MVDEIKPVKKMSPVAKYSMVAGAILTTLLLFGWFFDRDLLPPSKADVAVAHDEINKKVDENRIRQEKNDTASKIRDLRAEGRYVMDKIHHAKEDGKLDLVAALEARLKQINDDIDDLKKS